jgi:hypothetical protein
MLLRASLLLFVTTTCQLLPARPLSALVSGSDAIVAGTEFAETQAGNTVSFNLNVDRVFSGNLQSGATLNVVWHPKGFVSLPDKSPAYRGIWFLKSAANGTWECLSAGATGNAEFFPDLSLPISTGTLPMQLAYDAASTTVTDQIILEAAAGSPRSNSRMILDVISGLNSPGALRALGYLATLAGDQGIVGIAGLIRAGDTAGITAAEAQAESLAAGTPGADLIPSSIRLFFRSTDPAAVAVLGRIALSTTASPLMRDAAVAALVGVHPAAALPVFVTLLNGSSQASQIYGAQGLSYFVNGVGIPTAETMVTLSHLNQRQPSAYRTPDTDKHIGYVPGQQGAFISYWQTWLAAHPQLLSAATPQ